MPSAQAIPPADGGQPATDAPATGADPQSHPSVAAPKCVDCAHHQIGSLSGVPRAHICTHPAVPRNLVTGQPTRQCVDMRADLPPGYTRGPNGLIGCGSAGTLYQAKAQEAADANA